MPQYGEAAIKATALCRNRKVKSPVGEWKKAISMITQSKSSQEKICPRSAYLGLCENGMVRGIPLGQYLKPGRNLNKEYAISAVNIIKKKPHLTNNKRALWEKVLNGEQKAPNNQMDVVIALWKNGDIK